jgi:hypothetical protein
MTLEARKSFALGLNFKRATSGAALDLTGATVRMVLAQPAHRGGTVLMTKTAQAVSLAQGAVQVELQAVDLDLAAGEYPFDITLVSANGYSSPVMKGVVDVRSNVDLDTTGTYTGINPSTSLAVSVEQGNVVEVHVDKVDGLYVVVSTMIADFDTQMQAKLQAAGVSEDNAAAWAGAAADSAAAASDSEQAAAQSAVDAAGSAADAASSRASAENAVAAALQVQTNTELSQEAAASAQGSATAAASSATAASSSATAADSSATSAAASSTSAAASATAAAQSVEDAQAIVSGDLDPVIADKILDPASQSYDAVTTRIQETAGTGAAADITYAGSANLSATNVEAALDELDTEKAAVGHTHAAVSTAGLYRGAWALSLDMVRGTYDFADGTIPSIFTKSGSVSVQNYAAPSGGAVTPTPAKRLRIQGGYANAYEYAETTPALMATDLGAAAINKVRFWFMASSEDGYDVGEMTKNGAVQVSRTGTGGGGAWVQSTLSVSPADALRWLFRADSSGFAGEYAASVANIEAIETVTPNYQVNDLVSHKGGVYACNLALTTQEPGTGSDWTLVRTGVRAINAQTGTSYTLALTDVGKLVTLSNAAAVTLTVPTNATVAFPVGTEIDLAQLGAGQVTVAGAGVTINGSPGLKIAAQYGAATLLKLATDTWLLLGKLSA